MLSAMSVFTLPCSSCGAAVEIPGRLGFKLKSSGAGKLLCRRCRQSSFLQVRREQLARDVGKQTLLRRSVPWSAGLISLALTVVLVWWHQAHSNHLQDALPERVSPSR